MSTYGTRYRCQNCDATWLLEQLREIKDYHLRVEDGEPEPDGECPDCGCLCHEDEEGS